jgi:hypothetical protein
LTFVEKNINYRYFRIEFGKIPNKTSRKLIMTAKTSKLYDLSLATSAFSVLLRNKYSGILR